MKASDCWIGVWIIANHSPKGRYKIVAVLPAFTVPGPNKPKHMDSYFYTSFHHLSALQKDGFKLWDASKDEVVISHPFFALGMADGPALTHLNGLVGHMGYNGCRMHCGLRGRQKGNNKHYYPALMKPMDAPDDHTDADASAVSQTAPPSTEQYFQDLKIVIEATSERAYRLARKQTGIVKPSILLGIDSKHRFPITSCWGPDIMHLLCLNIPDLLIPLWRGESHMVHWPDSVQTWAFAVYADDDTWQRHGALVAAATPFLPASFDCPPHNPCEKLHSGYKAWEHMGYFYILGPGLFHVDFAKPYFDNFCYLVRGVHIMNQHEITLQELLEACDCLLEFVKGFEALYYDRRPERVHFVLQSIHQLLHLAWELF
ncbi:hypothetical protein DXG01_016602 [Tephrocybe rancida]|nr:hypothetical protein DXG01_016602 [Tephrocybe rancida]